MDIAKWHLFLADAHSAHRPGRTGVSHANFHSLDENKVVQILQNVPVKIGGGKREIL